MGKKGLAWAAGGLGALRGRDGDVALQGALFFFWGGLWVLGRGEVFFFLRTPRVFWWVLGGGLIEGFFEFRGLGFCFSGREGFQKRVVWFRF